MARRPGEKRRRPAYGLLCASPECATPAFMERVSVGARVLMVLGGLTVTATSLAPVSSGWKAQGIFAGLLLALPGLVQMVQRR